jgi:hypothetical protein
MKLLIKYGYQFMAINITEDVNLSSVIAALSAAKTYKEEGYGQNQRFIEKPEEHEIELKILDDAKFSDCQNDLTKNLLDRLETSKDETAKANSEKYKLQSELKDIRKKLKDIGINLDEENKESVKKTADITF